MGKRNLCVVCAGEPTVKSHIIPRALFHDMKRPGQQLVAGRRGGPGYRALQSGDWDRSILCELHESQLGAADAYGIRFCRNFGKQLAESKGKLVSQDIVVANPEPGRLVDFASACVWRMAASRSSGHPAHVLGPFADRIEGSLFGPGRRFAPMLLVSQNGLFATHGEAFNIGMLPFPVELGGLNFWRFVVCGLLFDLKLDFRRAPNALARLAVNSKATVTLPPAVSRDVRAVPGLMASLQRIAVSPRD